MSDGYDDDEVDLDDVSLDEGEKVSAANFLSDCFSGPHENDDEPAVQDDDAFDATLDMCGANVHPPPECPRLEYEGNPLVLRMMRRRLSERLTEENASRQDEYEECCDMAEETAEAAASAAFDASRAAFGDLDKLLFRVSRTKNCRILVKYPLGTRPIEMWVTAPSHLNVRPPELIECFSKQLSETKIENARRWLEPNGLLLMDSNGGVLSVANTLAASSVEANDVLLLFPSATRLKFLMEETSRLVKTFLEQEKQRLEENAESEEKTASPHTKSTISWMFGRGGSSDKNEIDCPSVGEKCWVRLPDGLWRRATVAVSVPTGVRTGVVLVRWANTSTKSIDEPRCAQVEVDKVQRTLPDGAEVAVEELEEENSRKGDRPDDDAPTSPRGNLVAAPRALHSRDALRIQVIWRLGNPGEALAAWLQIPAPHGRTVKPGALMRKFARKLAADRPQLRWRVVASQLCLATLDGAPLDESVPVLASLSAVASRRSRSNTGGSSSSSVSETQNDAYENEWRFPPDDAENTLLALPRMDEIFGNPMSASKNPILLGAKARTDRTGWLIESDGTYTACTMLAGRSAPVRNRIASTSSPSIQVAISSFADATTSADADLVNAHETARQAAVRISGGDVVLVETDRRTPGFRSRLRQVKLSQIVFADELACGAGPYGRRPRADGRPSPSTGIPGVPTGVVWYDDESAKRDLRAISDTRDKLLLQQVLPEFRRNGKLLGIGRRQLKRGEVVDLTFSYTSLGISVALAQEKQPSAKDGDMRSPRKALVIDAIGPTCPPQAQLTLAAGDELVKINGEPVDTTIEGYQSTIAKLRCGARPITLSFRKSRSDKVMIPPAPYTSSPANSSTVDLGAESNDNALEGAIAPTTATRADEVAVVDLTEDDCLDVDLDDEEYYDDDSTSDNEQTDAHHIVQGSAQADTDEEYQNVGEEPKFFAEGNNPEDEEEEELQRQVRYDEDEEEVYGTPSRETTYSPPVVEQTHLDKENCLAQEQTHEEADSYNEEEEKRPAPTVEKSANSASEEHMVREGGEVRGDGELERVQSVSYAVVTEEKVASEESDTAEEGAADLDEEDNEEKYGGGFFVPIVRSGELTGSSEAGGNVLLPVEDPAASKGPIHPVHRIPFQRTPRAMQPISTQIDGKVAEEDGPFGALLEPASPLGERLGLRIEPVEPAEEVHFCVYDREGCFRACVCHDGSVRSNRDELLGYLNIEAMQAGSASEDFLGELKKDINDTELAARGHFDEFCAVVDLSKTRLKDSGGSTLVEITSTGEAITNDGSRVGRFSPFSYSDFPAIALFLLFIDPGMISPLELEDGIDD